MPGTNPNNIASAAAAATTATAPVEKKFAEAVKKAPAAEIAQTAPTSFTDKAVDISGPSTGGRSV